MHIYTRRRRMSAEDGWTRVDCLCAVLLPVAQFLSDSRQWPETPAAELEKARRALALVRHLAIVPPKSLEAALETLEDSNARDALRDWIDELGPVDQKIVERFEAKLFAA